MKPKSSRAGFASPALHGVMAILCVALLSPGNSAVAQTQEAQSQVLTTTTTEEAPKIPND